MKRSFFTFLSLLVATLVFGQSNNTKENVFVFNTGIGYRVTPLDLAAQPMFYYLPFYYSRDEQVTGLAVNIGLMYYLSKPRLGFEYSNSFRYDILYFENDPLNDYNKRIFTVDYHFNVYKFIPLKKNNLRTGIGFSALNTGSDYTFMEQTVFNGDTILQSNYDDFHFNTFNVIFGYQVNQVSFELVNRFTTQHRFSSIGQFWFPELKLTYNLKLKNKKSFD